MPKRQEKKKSDDLDDLITQTEAARLRGVSRAAIRALILRGRIRSVEMFGRNLVYRSEVLSFEKEKTGPKKKQSR
jgi:excisionase family DNA binding protein